MSNPTATIDLGNAPVVVDASALLAAGEQQRLADARTVLCKVLNTLHIGRVDGTLSTNGDDFVITDLVAFDESSQPTVFDTAGPIAVGGGEHRRTYASLQEFIADYVTAQLRHKPVEFLTGGTLSLHASGFISYPLDWAARFAAESKQRLAEMQARKGPLCSALDKLGIATVVAVYDGEGDSGQIDSIAAYGADEAEMPIKGSITVGDAPPEAMHQALDEFLWECLTAYHDGFEINEGGYGEITIDVAKATVSIDHNDRIIEVINTMSEI